MIPMTRINVIALSWTRFGTILRTGIFSASRAIPKSCIKNMKSRFSSRNCMWNICFRVSAKKSSPILWWMCRNWSLITGLRKYTEPKTSGISKKSSMSTSCGWRRNIQIRSFLQPRYCLHHQVYWRPLCWRSESGFSRCQSLFIAPLLEFDVQEEYGLRLEQIH